MCYGTMIHYLKQSIAHILQTQRSDERESHSHQYQRDVTQQQRYCDTCMGDTGSDAAFVLCVRVKHQYLFKDL